EDPIKADQIARSRKVSRGCVSPSGDIQCHESSRINLHIHLLAPVCSHPVGAQEIRRPVNFSSDVFVCQHGKSRPFAARVWWREPDYRREMFRKCSRLLLSNDMHWSPLRLCVFEELSNWGYEF